MATDHERFMVTRNPAQQYRQLNIITPDPDVSKGLPYYHSLKELQPQIFAKFPLFPL